jgi:collagen triple helix repeat protein
MGIRMFSAIRKRVTYANVAMTVALVFAMSGGAYAAGKYLITSTKQIKPSVLAQLKGKNGMNGANGTNGANGAPGATGAQGPKGDTGAGGPQGPEGKEGKEGKAGANGTTGFTETLPSHKTLEGAWTLSYRPPAGPYYNTTSVSFGIPLKEAPAAHFINLKGLELTFTSAEDPTGERASTACTGTPQTPTAAPGNLCVYLAAAGTEETELAENELVDENFNGLNWKKPLAVFDPTIEGGPRAETPGTASVFGFGVRAATEKEGHVFLQGSWAVTAE